MSLAPLVAAVEGGTAAEAAEALRCALKHDRQAAFVLRALLEDLADARGDCAATHRLLSFISERAHSDACAAARWPLAPAAGAGACGENAGWLPIVPVRGVRLAPGGGTVEGVDVDAALLARRLREHSWCVLRLAGGDSADTGGKGSGAAELAAALEGARRACGRFFAALPEARKRELTEVPGGDRRAPFTPPRAAALGCEPGAAISGLNRGCGGAGRRVRRARAGAAGVARARGTATRGRAASTSTWPRVGERRRSILVTLHIVLVTLHISDFTYPPSLLPPLPRPPP
jgi:hypothetical protein